MSSDNSLDADKPTLERGLGPWQATALNVANMVGIGPFITIPLFIQAMPGPQCLIAWVIAAILVLCDGLVWSELGAALPGSGGTYHFLREAFGGHRWGRLLPFLFIWQFLISGALEMASGYIGAVDYLEYAFPGLAPRFEQWGIPGGIRWLAAGSVILITLLLCQRIRNIGWMGIVLCAGTIVTVLIVILSGLSHFDSTLLRMPQDAFRLDMRFATGLGGAMLIAIYDYLGYYNVCHLGDEVRQPEKTIPRAVIMSVVIVAAVYLTMNVSIIGVIPWEKAMHSKNIAAEFMERLYGRDIAIAFTILILWTVIACMFAITLGYSRIPYAAAKQGDFFPAFARIHPTGRYPITSLWALGFFTAAFCFFDLKLVIDAAVCVRIAVQFIGQIVALHWLRTKRPDIQFPFRMALYPLPSFLALVGWIYVLATANRTALWVSAGVIVSGCLVFIAWKRPSSSPSRAA